MAAITIEGLTEDHGRTRAIDGLDLEVAAGEIYGFLGPNGAGKTTTIRLLIDLIRPTTGTATVLGMDPRRAGVGLRRRVGYLAGDFVVDGRQTGPELLTHLGNLSGGLAQRLGSVAQRCQPRDGAVDGGVDRDPRGGRHLGVRPPRRGGLDSRLRLAGRPAPRRWRRGRAVRW